MSLTFKEVAEILKIIDASACEEVVLDLAGIRLEVRRGSTASGAAPRASTGSTPASGQGAAAAAQPVAAFPMPGGSRKPTPVPLAPGVIEVRAPMVGTFYRRPSPEAEPFAEVGRRVKAGDPIGLIEVMKLFTTIPAPSDGIIDTIAIDNAGPVEFDQVIMTLRRT